MKEKFDYYDSSVSSLLFIILQYLFLNLYVLLPPALRSGAVVIIAGVLLEGTFLLTVYLTSKISNKKMFVATKSNKKVNPVNVFISIVLAVVLLIFASPMTNVFASVLDKVGYESGLGMEINSFYMYLICIVTTCIVPAVTEEFLFRGCIAGGL